MRTGLSGSLLSVWRGSGRDGEPDEFVMREQCSSRVRLSGYFNIHVSSQLAKPAQKDTAARERFARSTRMLSWVLTHLECHETASTRARGAGTTPSAGAGHCLDADVSFHYNCNARGSCVVGCRRKFSRSGRHKSTESNRRRAAVFGDGNRDAVSGVSPLGPPNTHDPPASCDYDRRRDHWCCTVFHPGISAIRGTIRKCP